MFDVNIEYCSIIIIIRKLEDSKCAHNFIVFMLMTNIVFQIAQRTGK